MIRSRLLIVPLFERLRLTTTGNGIAAPLLNEIIVPDIVGLLASAEEVTVVSLTEGGTTNFRWNVYFASGYNRGTELASGPFPIAATAFSCVPPLTFVSARSAPYNTITNFLLESRVLVGYGNQTGAAIESGVASASLLVKTVGM